MNTRIQPPRRLFRRLFVLGDDTAGVAQRYGNLNAEVTLTSGSMTVNNGVFTVKSLKTTANGSAAVAENANLTLKSLAGEAGAVTVSGNGVLTVESLLLPPRTPRLRLPSTSAWLKLRARLMPRQHSAR